MQREYKPVIGSFVFQRHIPAADFVIPLLPLTVPIQAIPPFRYLGEISLGAGDAFQSGQSLSAQLSFELLSWSFDGILRLFVLLGNRIVLRFDIHFGFFYILGGSIDLGFLQLGFVAVIVVKDIDLIRGIEFRDVLFLLGIFVFSLFFLFRILADGERIIVLIIVIFGLWLFPHPHDPLTS